MVSRSRTRDYFLSLSLNNDKRFDLNKFLRNFNDHYNHLYITSDWQNLKTFIYDSLVSLEALTLAEYSKKAERILAKNFNSLSEINTSLSKTSRLDMEAPNKELLYPNIILEWIMTPNVKVHNCDYEFQVPDLDSLIKRYSIYSTMYVSLVDICIKLYEFDSAIEKLMQLGILMYFLRVEMRTTIWENKEKLRIKFDDDLSQVYKILDRKGIYLHSWEKDLNDTSIIKKVVEYWKTQNYLELWSRLIKIYLNIDSIYNCLNKIETMPVSVRMKIFFNIKFTFSQEPIRKIISENFIENLKDTRDEEYEDVDRPENIKANAVETNSKEKKNLYEIVKRISRSHIISHVFSSSFNFQCFFIEGVLFFAHISKDFQEELSSMIYSILFDVLHIYISINMYFRYHHKKQITNKLLYALLGFLKLHFKHYNFIPPILQMVSNKYRWEKRLEGTEEERIMPKYFRESSILKKFQNPILGFHQISSVLKSDLEYNFLFHSHNTHDFLPKYYENFKASANTVGNRNKKSVKFNLDYKHLEPTRLNRGLARGTSLGKLKINGVKISDFTKSQEMYNHTHFIRTLYNIQSQVRIKNIKKTTYLTRDYKLNFKRGERSRWIIERFPDHILSAIIAFCFLMDDIYIFIHYSHSLEYLQYRDTLKTKNRAIVQALLPFVPKRSSKDAKKIISFQKHIKRKFKRIVITSKNYIPLIPNLKKTYHLISRMSRRKEPRPKCLIEVKKKQNNETKVAFEVTSVKRTYRPRIPTTKLHRVINPIRKRFKMEYQEKQQVPEFDVKRANKLSVSQYRSNLANLLNSYTTGQNIDNNRFFGSVSKCIHMSLGSSYKECDFCNKLNNFNHLSQLMYLIDLLSHYMFTLNISSELDLSTECRGLSRLKQMALPLQEEREIRMSKHEMESKFGEIMGQIDKNFYHKACSYRNKNDWPFNLVKEMLENTILLAMSTVFHEEYYKHLISRLATYHLSKGRYNIALGLMKQTLDESNTYKIDYGASSGHLEENYICNVDKSFLTQLTNKIYIDLLNDIYSFRELNQLTKETNLWENKMGDIQEEEEYYSRYRLCLMAGVTYMREAPSKVVQSVSILDSSFRKMELKISESNSQYIYFPRNQRSSDVEEPERESYTSTMKLGMDTFLKAVRMDPLDYKGWYYLAQCSLYCNDLHFSYKCCERSIECFDSCVASWLTKVLCSSARVRTCVGLYTDDETWNSYTQKRSKLDGVAFKSLPSPLEPIFNKELKTLEELEENFSRCVGDDFESCMMTLLEMERFENVYVASCALQILSKMNRNYNSYFKWELNKSYNVPFTNTPMTQREVEQPLRTQREEKPSTDFLNHVKKMVTTTIEANYLICSVPFMNLILHKYLRKTYNLRCRHHSVDFSDYNSSGLSLNFMEEELYGWMTCIEVLAHLGEGEVAEQLLPLLNLYMEYYSLDKYYKKKSEKNICKVSQTNRNQRKLVQQYFGGEPIIGIDLRNEIKYINFYIKCYNSKGSKESLKDLLLEARRLNIKRNYRKLSLMENRILAGLGEHSESVQLGNNIHRMSMKVWQYTDFDLEHKSLLAYAYSLKMTGQTESSQKVATFANQLYLTTPTVKMDLCLNVPL